MAYSAVPTRTTADANASADINQLQDNIAYVKAEVDDGWVVLNDTLSYASASTINTTADLTGILQKGMKLKITQSGSAKYFDILAVTSSLITVTAGTTYTVANAAITSPYYSSVACPFGWPTTGWGWTPTGTNIDMGGAGVLDCSFHLSDGWCEGEFKYTFDGADISGAVSIDPPITIVSPDQSIVGQGRAVETGVTSYSLITGITSSKFTLIRFGVGEVNVTVPHVWKATDILIFNFRYRY